MIRSRFGRLSVTSRDSSRSGRRRYWLCNCVCGSRVSVREDSLVSGRTQSCKCLQKDRQRETFTTHGMSGRPEYQVWADMIGRCENENRENHERYGGRGIEVCPAWRESFEAFLADVGPRPSRHYSIERIDNARGYEPGNCRWATAAEQSRNKRNTHSIEHAGRTMCLADWARHIGICPKSLRKRIHKWGVQRALSTPPQIQA